MYPRLARWPNLARRLLGNQLSGPDRLRITFEEIGGTIIKFGQILAMQSDMIPLEYCRGLFGLFDRVPPFEYEHVQRTFLEDLGKTPEQIFESFNTIPFATGSIGQVHRGMLKGCKVAVKVRRPTILDDFAVDIAWLTFLVNVVKLLRIERLSWIVSPTEEFVAWTREELDYRREAHYMDELGRNARTNQFERVPAVFWNSTTARILTVEFLEGITISDYLRNEETGASPDFNPKLFAGRLIDNFLEDAFDHGMFHADLHPGNLMIMPGNVVGYIDFGISGVLSRYSRRHLIATTLGIARGDIDDMCDSFFRISTFAQDADLAGFRKRLKEKSETWYGIDGTSSLRITITTLMLELLLLSREKGVWPQRDVIKYIRSAIALDGLIRTFSPDMDVGGRLVETSERNMKSEALLTLISSQSVAAVIEGYTHLMRDGVLRLSAALRRFDSENMVGESRSAPHTHRNNARRFTQYLSLAWICLCMTLLFRSEGTGIRLQTLPSASLLWSIAISVIAWGLLKVARIV